MSVWDKLADGAYTNTREYPPEPRKPVLAKDATPAQVRAYADLLEMHDVHMQEYREQLKNYNMRTHQLEDAFKHDLEVEYHMMGHDKADLLYAKAWHMGHAGGLHEVAHHYSDLVELVK